MEKRLPTTSLHWHAHAVAALAFTPSGSQLLSVGEESVLVQWHLASGKREYIPRLGGKPILSLAIKQAAVKGQEEEWWMAFADGAVQKVGAGSGRIEGVGQGVKIGKSPCLPPRSSFFADSQTLYARPTPLRPTPSLSTRAPRPSSSPLPTPAPYNSSTPPRRPCSSTSKWPPLIAYPEETINTSYPSRSSMSLSPTLSRDSVSGWPL